MVQPLLSFVAVVAGGWVFKMKLTATVKRLCKMTTSFKKIKRMCPFCCGFIMRAQQTVSSIVFINLPYQYQTILYFTGMLTSLIV